MNQAVVEFERVSPELVASYAALSSATVHEASGGKGALHSRIKPIVPEMRVVGPVVTVKAEPGDNLVLHHAIYCARPGDVLVVDAGGYREAGPWGEIMTVAAMQRGIAGLVINGAARDADPIAALRFPLFATSLSIKGTKKQASGSINRPLDFEGVRIEPGDLVLGDRDGVVVVARAEAEQVLQKSLARDAKEAAIMERLKRGETTIEIYSLANLPAA